MEITEDATRRLQRSLNALGRGESARPLAVDGVLDRRTGAAFFRFLAARGANGEALLGRALRAL